jgi:hypothetical protein
LEYVASWVHGECRDAKFLVDVVDSLGHQTVHKPDCLIFFRNSKVAHHPTVSNHSTL